MWVFVKILKNMYKERKYKRLKTNNRLKVKD